MKIDILGTNYKIKLDVINDERLDDIAGYIDQSEKLIAIAKVEPCKDSIKDLKGYRNKVLRHEILHAFMYESGLWTDSNGAEAWAMNEEMIDWIAIQSPKIFDAFKKCNCI